VIDILESRFPEVKIIKRKMFPDTRGSFTELFNSEHYSQFFMNGIAQTNVSDSKVGVIRGLHWQSEPFSQGKLISCLAGSVFDVVVDLRKSSSTFGKHINFNLNSITGEAIWIPPGFAHGFQSLESNTKFIYFTSTHYSLENSLCINPLDSELAINWPLPSPTLSNADLNAPKLMDISRCDLFG
jgi:dTDP-4-dehydrorhamnose 3,5-epimerase